MGKFAEWMEWKICWADELDAKAHARATAATRCRMGLPDLKGVGGPPAAADAAAGRAHYWTRTVPPIPEWWSHWYAYVPGVAGIAVA